MKNLYKPAALLGLHLLYYTCVELMINDLAAGALGADNVVALYGAISVAVAAGFLLFPLMRRIFKRGVEQKIALAAAWALNLASYAAVLTVRAPLPFSMAAVLVTLTAGYIGGYVFYTIATGAVEKTVIGRFFGITAAAVILLQFVCTKLIALIGDNGLIVKAFFFAAAISACCVILLFFSGLAPFRIVRREALPEPQKNIRRFLWGAFFIIAAIWAMEGVIDGVITGLHANQELNVSQIPRLLHAAGLLLAGFIFDYKEGRFFAPVTMLFMIAQVVAVFMFSNADGINVALGAVYLCGAFGSVYSLAALTHSASSSTSPALWAVMGRVAKYVPSGVMAVVGGYFYTSNSNTVFTLIYIVLLGALFLLFLMQGKLSVQLPAPAQASPDAPPPPPPPTMEKLIAMYGVTGRETEVLRLLIGGKKTDEIAEALCVTIGTVYKYISSMTKKTKTDNRSELIALFSDIRA